jgi:hypothetical protein
VNSSTLIFAGFASLIIATSPAAAAKPPPANWDGLVLTKSKRLDYVYLQPGADFRGYTKVMLDPTEVAFHKKWQKEYNATSRNLSGRVSDSEVQEAVSEGIKASTDIFAKAWQNGGYAVVSAPGPDVLQVKTGILNISVSAPDRPTAGRSYTFSDTAGQATLMVEARDSMTGALLGRAVDTKIAGDNTIGWRSSVGNRADFRALVDDWAKVSVKGLAELKALSPITP